MPSPIDPSTPGAGASGTELAALRATLVATEPAYLADLGYLVGIDSGSWSPAGVDRVGAWVAGFLRELGADVSTHPDPGGRLGRPSSGSSQEGRAGRADSSSATSTPSSRRGRQPSARSASPAVVPPDRASRTTRVASWPACTLSARSSPGARSPSSGWSSSRTRTRRSARRRRPCRSGRSPRGRTSRSSSSAGGQTGTSSRRARAHSTSSS